MNDGWAQSTSALFGLTGCLACLGIVCVAADIGGDGAFDLMLAGFGGTLFVTLPFYAMVERKLGIEGVGLPGALGGVLLAAALMWAFEGDGVTSRWAAALDRPASVHTVGSWLDGENIVRARQDEIIAYRVRNGARAWAYSPPGQDTVCAMSREVNSGIGLIGHAAVDRPCNAITALDLRTGSPLWTKTVDGTSRLNDDAAPSQVAIAGGLAIIREPGTVDSPALDERRERPGRIHALDLHSGRERWQWKAGRRCGAAAVTGGTAAVVVEDCGAKGLWLRRLRPEDGHVDTNARLPVRQKLEDFQTLSARPLVVRVREDGHRGTDAVLSYGDRGELWATVPVASPEGDLQIQFDQLMQFAARPPQGAVVIGGLLIAPAVRPTDAKYSRDSRGRVTGHTDSRLVAYSLADGGQRWVARFHGEVAGVTAEGPSVVVSAGDHLLTFAALSGRRLSTKLVHGAYMSPSVDLWVADDRYVVVEPDGTRTHPVRVLG